MKKFLSLILTLTLSLCVLCIGAAAKTDPAGQTVGTVLFYVRSSAGEDILVSHTTVADMEADMKAERIDTQNHNYSLLDRYITTVHQEAQGFTVPDFVTYAQSKSELDFIRELKLTFTGSDEINFWEIDQTGFDNMDSYTYDDLYGKARYNFPLLYEYWNYRTQDYYDPAGKMNRDEVIDYIFSHGEAETMLLSVQAYSQRYMLTDDKYSSGDFNMENLWQTSDLLDNARAIRIMLPMTEDDLRNKLPTASNTRYWVSNILLNMEKAPELAPLGTVSVPNATMTEDADNYYISFDCETPGATILFNHNYISPSYTPSSEYNGGVVEIPKSAFRNGTVTMTCCAVKDGYTDAGVQTLKLTSSGEYVKWTNQYSDVSESAWYYDYVEYVMSEGYFNSETDTSFAPDTPMARAMLVTALYRMAGAPAVTSEAPFTDVAPSAAYADAVAWCYETGIVNGKTDTTFDPVGSITREQITAMFHRYAEKAAKADMSIHSDLSAFSDADKLSGYAIDSMKWAVGAGLISGMTETTIVPKGTATRAQAAAMVMRLADYIA